LQAAPPLLAADLASAAATTPVATAAEPAAPPPVDSAAVIFPAWVPPWDESQRQSPTPNAPVTAAPPATEAASAPAERSIFAPLAAGAVASARPADSPTNTPPADLPPFLAGAMIPARFAPAPPAGSEAPLEQPAAPAMETAASSVVAPGEASPSEVSPAEGAAAEAPPTPGAGLVSIRGRMDGLAIEVGAGPWTEITAALAARLDQSASFFRNANVALDLGARALAEDELNAVATLLHKHGMALALVRTGAERTFQSALALGLTVTLEGADGAAMAEAAAATTNVNTAGFFVYRGYLRSGNRLRRQEHVLVIGDVNPGAEVISDGDVLVWGRLRGIVHAGAAGNVRSIVAALDMEPTQLRIADVMTTSPDPQPGQPGKWFWQRSAHKRAEVARLVHKAITFEEWDAGRPGGLVSLRRSG
jgi:septum site-determining protein MinC